MGETPDPDTDVSISEIPTIQDTLKVDIDGIIQQTQATLEALQGGTEPTAPASTFGFSSKDFTLGL